MSYTLTLVVPPEFSELTRLVEQLKTQFCFMEPPIWLEPERAVDLALTRLEVDHALAKVDDLCADLPVDYAILPSEQRRKKLLIADMDSTIIAQECIDELAAEVGLKAEIAAITAAAMAGQLEFEPALRQRVWVLQGLPEQIIEEVINKRITLNPGAKTLVQTMKTHGVYTALVSGGFTVFTRKIAAQIGFDETRANVLLTDRGTITGFVREPILGRKAKVEALLDIADEQGINLEDTMAIGDGANDIDMLVHADFGVAYHAKPAVIERADACIVHTDLTTLLYFQGFARKDWVL